MFKRNKQPPPPPPPQLRVFLLAGVLIRVKMAVYQGCYEADFIHQGEVRYITIPAGTEIGTAWATQYIRDFLRRQLTTLALELNEAEANLAKEESI